MGLRLLPDACAACAGPIALPADVEVADFSWWPGRAVITASPNAVRVVHATDCEYRSEE